VGLQHLHRPDFAGVYLEGGLGKEEDIGVSSLIKL
jgi:hypothetical protein